MCILWCSERMSPFPHRPTVITIASSKGGVGKSTACIMLAGLFTARGLGVHIIDLDENQTVQRWFNRHQTSRAALTVTAVAPADFTAHLKDIVGHPNPPDLVLIDVAGVYEKALLQAMGRSHLVIIPAQPSEPDIHEATKIVRDLADLNDNFGGSVPYRLLLNLFEPLDPHYQRHSVSEIARLGLQRFDTVMHKRAPYREAFMTGQTPHHATEPSPSIDKARAELDALATEITDLFATTSVKEAA
ncbi:MAG: ParA family protein [Proteobacteria bacterium]|nr:ParA family protein [Pseudomonadota bacterium]